MKNLKKWIAIVSAALFSLSFIACQQNNDRLLKYANRPNKVSVELFESGYGTLWFEDIAVYYMENIDTETYIDIKTTVLNSEETAKLEAGISTYDLYLLDNLYSEKSYLFSDLSDVVNDYALGESAENSKIIKEKIDADLYDIYSDNGKIYQLPWHTQQGYGWAYNKTTIDDALGEKNWRVPRTTDEFFELGDRLQEKSVYLFVASYGDQEDYTKRGTQTWFAQMLGEEGFKRYINAYAKDSIGEWYFCEDAPDMIQQNEDGIKAMYEVVKKLHLSGNGYLHSDSASMTFMDVESSFVGYGFGRNLRKPAFLFNGPWLENEMGELIDHITLEGKPQEIRMMKMPIISDIIARTPSIKDEATLRQVISYIDGETDVLPNGVEAEDVSIVEEARRMVPTMVSGTMVIPKKASNIEGAKDFLRFLASDVAQKITTESTFGINMLPFGYQPLEEDLKTNFIRDLNNINKNSIRIEGISISKVSEFASVTGFLLQTSSSDLGYGISIQDPVNVQSADEYYEELYNYYNNRWPNMIENYKLATGK